MSGNRAKLEFNWWMYWAAGSLILEVLKGAGDARWWHVLTALALGIPLSFLLQAALLWALALVQWAELPLLGAGLLIYLAGHGMHVWLARAGLACLVGGLLCGAVAKRWESPAWGLNGLGGLLIGGIMLVTGLVMG